MGHPLRTLRWTNAFDLARLSKARQRRGRHGCAKKARHILLLWRRVGRAIWVSILADELEGRHLLTAKFCKNLWLGCRRSSTVREARQRGAPNTGAQGQAYLSFNVRKKERHQRKERKTVPQPARKQETTNLLFGKSLTASCTTISPIQTTIFSSTPPTLRRTHEVSAVSEALRGALHALKPMDDKASEQGNERRPTTSRRWMPDESLTRRPRGVVEA